MGCCAVVLAAWISPRFVLFLMWVFGDQLGVAFDSFWTGLAGFIFLPWTSLAFALAYAPTAAVSGIGWLFVAVGLVADLGAWLGGGREGRGRWADA
jgi:hypothetical protein